MCAFKTSLQLLLEIFCIFALTFNNVISEQNVLVVGGQTAKADELPYQLALYETDLTHLGTHCGASLIEVDGLQVAITAANCSRAANLTLTAGYVSMFQGPENKQTRDVLHVESHPDYSATSLSNNIALIFFDPFEMNEYVNSIKLPPAGQQTLGGILTVSGWGNDGDNQGIPSIELHLGNLSVVDDASCQESYRILDTPILDSMLCGMSENGKVVPTNFDNGGPAVSSDGYLAGVYIFNDTGKDFPAVFTEVAYFVDWIKETVDDYQNGDSTATTTDGSEITTTTESYTTISTDRPETTTIKGSSSATSTKASTPEIIPTTGDKCLKDSCSNAAEVKAGFVSILMLICIHELAHE